MKTKQAMVAASVLVLCAAAGFAQDKPNFSGQWKNASSRHQSGGVQIVEQTATTLTITQAMKGGQRAIYKLDGTETRNVISSHGGEIVTTSKLAWKGDKLTIASATTYPNGRKRNDSQVWSLDAEGRLLVEHTQTTPSGPKTTKAVYTKLTKLPARKFCRTRTWAIWHDV